MRWRRVLRVGQCPNRLAALSCPSSSLGTRCTDAGSGWWWCQIAATVAEANSTINFAFYCALTSGATFTDRVVFTGNGTSGLYLWRGRLAEGNEIT